MIKIIPFLFLSIIPSTTTSQVFGQSAEVQYLLSSLEQKCGYRLSDSMAQSVTTVETRTIKNVHHFDVYLKVKLTKRSFDAKMGFSCESPINGNTGISNLSPKEVIINEDSGGRYGRNVEWERAFTAANWKGKVAYVNSIFGDGIKMPLPDYLLICPLSFNALCTSFEVIDNTRLKQKEVNALVRLLETIGWLRQGETKEPDKK